MITEYAVPSLALNYHRKKYQIISEIVYSYLCTCMRKKYSCKKYHIQVMLKVYFSISILNIHELLETWLPGAKFIKFLDWQSNVHWPKELTICPDINGFQIPVKTSCTGHRWCKACFLFREHLLGMFSLFFFFFCFMSSVFGRQTKCLNSHYNYPVHLINTDMNLSWM